jgi:heterodisulfide reductase subunit C
MMTLQLRLAQCMECRCCRQLIFEERQESSWVTAGLYGAKSYAICPQCGQETGSGAKDRNFRARARRYVRAALSGKKMFSLSVRETCE